MIIQINNETLSEIREKLATKSSRAEAIDMLKAMKDAREMHTWRSGAMPSCCVNLDSLSCKFSQEFELLDEAIRILENGNDTEADPVLDKLREQFACEIGWSTESIRKFERENFS